MHICSVVILSFLDAGFEPHCPPTKLFMCLLLLQLVIAVLAANAQIHCSTWTLRGSCCTVCALHTQMPGYSPRIAYLLFDSTAKQQSPQDNNETAFKLVLQCLYEQTTQPCKVQLCRGMHDAHMFKWQVPKEGHSSSKAISYAMSKTKTQLGPSHKS